SAHRGASSVPRFNRGVYGSRGTPSRGTSLTTALRQAVLFECEGCQLYGTLRRPEGLVSSSDTGVVILNQGPLDRSGTHQISTKIVKRFNAFSIPTLQFDARGVGES